MKFYSRIAIGFLVTMLVLLTAPYSIAQASGPPVGETAVAKTVAPVPVITLTTDDLATLADSVEQLTKADTDLQTARLFGEAAQAKADRASMLLEARKLRILALKHLSPETHEVAYIAPSEGKPKGEWLIRPRPPAKPQTE